MSECLSVRPSVRPSHSRQTSKWLKISKYLSHPTIDDDSIFDAKFRSHRFTWLGCRLVPKVVNLNDLERYNGRYILCVISPNLVVLGHNYVTVVKVRPILSGQNSSPVNLVFSNI